MSNDKPIPTGISAYKAADGSTQSSYGVKPGMPAALPWTVDGDGISSNGRRLMSFWQVFPKGIDDRQEGESWLEMRDRTQAARDAVASETRDRAAFVVRACAAHDQLVEAMRMLIWNFESGSHESYGSAIAMARAALTKAGISSDLPQAK